MTNDRIQRYYILEHNPKETHSTEVIISFGSVGKNRKFGKCTVPRVQVLPEQAAAIIANAELDRLIAKGYVYDLVCDNNKKIYQREQ